MFGQRTGDSQSSRIDSLKKHQLKLVVGGSFFIIVAAVSAVAATYRQPHAIQSSAETSSTQQPSNLNTPLTLDSLQVSTNKQSLVQYSSLNLKECRHIGDDADTGMQIEARKWDDVKQVCPATGPYQISIISFPPEPRSWIIIQHKTHTWTLEKVIVKDPQNQFGHFPMVTGTAELATDLNTGKILGLIVPVEAQDELDAFKTQLQYFVVRTDGQVPCFAGRTKALEDARKLITGTGSCQALDEQSDQ